MRMVIEVRPKPCEELEECSTGRGRSGLSRQARRSRRASRATRSPSQGFASRVYWKHITQGELRRAGKGSAGLSEAIALATDARSIRGPSAAGPPEASAAAQTEDSGCDSQPAPQATTLNALLTTAVEAHTRKVLDQRIQNEWEMVTEIPELDEYVVL